MKSFYGRGMAQGYARGRAHIRELNRQKAEKLENFYVCIEIPEVQGGGWQAECGPYESATCDACKQAFKNCFQVFGQAKLKTESDISNYDPQGIARLKANPKV